MNKTPSESHDLASDIARRVRKDETVEVVVCPSFVALDRVSQSIEGSALKLGAQNLYPKPNGAYTGEVSAEMLRAVFAKYVILGHSERRQYFEESNNFVNEKVRFALENLLCPILCVGETLEQREAELTMETIEAQLLTGIEGVADEDLPNLVVAYEPVWAIGTGKTATPEIAQEAHAHIRAQLADKRGAALAEKVRVLYGGSMKPDSAPYLLAQKDIDGGLIGGASLEAKSFCDIVEAAREAD